MASTTEGRTAGEAPSLSEPLPATVAYRSIRLLRLVDETADRLARAGEMGVHVPCRGQEALLAGVAAATRAGDWLMPGPRQSSIGLLRGLSLVSHFSQLLGRSADPSRGRQAPGHPTVRSLNLFSVATPVGSQLIQAAGVGLAMKRAERGEVAVTLGGAGAVATADFHVGMNFTALWAVPVVHVFAVATDDRSELPGPAARAAAHGLHAVEVDGADARAVHDTMAAAMERARSGEGPTLVEASFPEPLRVTPESGLRLVGDSDETSWSEVDPLERCRRDSGLAAADADAIDAELQSAVDDGVAAALALPAPPTSLLFDDVFAERTPALEAQRREWLAQRKN
ncbi:MAG: thiamine pyrophosphate-dependent enzyme [Acidobacteriota bacterium]